MPAQQVLTRPSLRDRVTQPEPRDVLLVAAAIFAISLIVRLVCFTGLIASDDVIYAEYAAQISNWSYQPEANQFAVRLGLLLPVAAVYSLFGIGEWSTVAVPLLASALAAALAALIAARISGLTAAWVAGLLLATFPQEVRYASILVPEPVLQVFLLGGALLYLVAERRSSALIAWAAGLTFGFAWLTKEPAAFVPVAFVLAALLHRQWRLAAWVAAGAATVVLVETVWYLTQTGDLLYRLHALGTHNTRGGGLDPLAAPPDRVAYRLFQAYPSVMLIPNSFFGLHSLAALAMAAAGLLTWFRSRAARLLVLWAAVPWLYLNFGSTSFSRYVVIPALPRYISFVYAPLFILAAFVGVKWAAGRARRVALAIALAAVCLAGIAAALNTRGSGYYTHHVRDLETIATTARQQDRQICQFEGIRREVWRRVLWIIAPDRIRCSAAEQPTIRLVPDSAGRPVPTSAAVGPLAP